MGGSGEADSRCYSGVDLPDPGAQSSRSGGGGGARSGIRGGSDKGCGCLPPESRSRIEEFGTAHLRRSNNSGEGADAPLPALHVDSICAVGKGGGEIRRSPQGDEMGRHAGGGALGCAAPRHLILATGVNSRVIAQAGLIAGGSDYRLPRSEKEKISWSSTAANSSNYCTCDDTPSCCTTVLIPSRRRSTWPPLFVVPPPMRIGVRRNRNKSSLPQSGVGGRPMCSISFSPDATSDSDCHVTHRRRISPSLPRSEERRVGKECRN